MQKSMQSGDHARIAGACLGAAVTIVGLTPGIPWAQSAQPSSHAAPTQRTLSAASDETRSANTFVLADPAFAGGMQGRGRDGAAVAGAPYSAESVTETTQTLADGNRIVHRQTGSFARDSQGRLRRELAVAPPAGAPAQAEAEAPRWIEIEDTVAGVSYTLDEQRRTAMKHPALMLGAQLETVALASSGADTPGVSMRAVTRTVDIRDAGQATAAEPAHTIEPFSPVFFAAGATSAAGGSEKTEALGKQTIEGVEAEGTRTTVTLPAGSIGNERAIDVVTERWYSAALQVAVLTTRHDPLIGVTTERLVNISRAEPSPSLFEVPADYKVIEPSFARARLRNVSH